MSAVDVIKRAVERWPSRCRRSAGDDSKGSLADLLAIYDYLKLPCTGCELVLRKITTSEAPIAPDGQVAPGCGPCQLPTSNPARTHDVTRVCILNKEVFINGGVGRGKRRVHRRGRTGRRTRLRLTDHHCL